MEEQYTQIKIAITKKVRGEKEINVFFLSVCCVPSAD
jgi:hypothetical protein